jgi:hypothetical protein
MDLEFRYGEGDFRNYEKERKQHGLRRRRKGIDGQRKTTDDGLGKGNELKMGINLHMSNWPISGCIYLR